MKYYAMANYCCGEGTWITVANGVVVDSGMEVVDETGKIVRTFCALLDNLPGRPTGPEWIEVPSKDGRYWLDETNTFQEIIDDGCSSSS